MHVLRAALLVLFLLLKPAFAESPQIFVSLGQQLTGNVGEASLRYVGKPYFWKLQPVFGLSTGTNGSGWVGVGSAVTWRAYQGGYFLRVSSMAGINRRGKGPDLGGPVQFRSALDLGIRRRKGMEFGIGADHRSSARIYRPNPGLNTVYLFASMPSN